MVTKELSSGIYYNIFKDTISQDIKIKSSLTEAFEINFNDFTNSITIKYYDKEYRYENLHELMNDLMKVSNNYNRL